MLATIMYAAAMLATAPIQNDNVRDERRERIGASLARASRGEAGATRRA